MRGSIGVRINDGINDRTVTRLVRGLKFSKQADGGHKAASFNVTTPLGTFTDLGPSDRAYIYDTRHGGALFEGYTEAPTPTSGPNGEAYAISALGAMVRASDETRRLVYVDKAADSLAKDPFSAASAGYDTGPWVSNIALARARVQLNPGQPLSTGSFAGAECTTFTKTDMGLGAIGMTVQSGKVDANYIASFAHPLGQVDVNLAGNTQITTTQIGFALFVGSNFPSPTAYFSMRLRRSGAATNVADDLTWTDFANLSVVGQRVSRAGALLTGASMVSATSVTASDVIEDLLGRLLTFCDPNTSSVAVTSFAINQLSYADGTNAQKVLDDLGDFEPGYLWEILHSTTGGHIFNYRAWPTVVRYEIATRDGYVESGSDSDLCNRIAVNWVDAAGNQQTTVVTATSATYPALKALEDAGRIRDADPVTLPDGTGSLTNAQALGAAILSDKAGQPTPARAVVRRPIRDLYTGAMVMPWEIEPGYIVRVRDEGLDLRLTAMEYDDDSCSTSLDLGYPSLTRDQRIARLAKA